MTRNPRKFWHDSYYIPRNSEFKELVGKSGNTAPREIEKGNIDYSVGGVLRNWVLDSEDKERKQEMVNLGNWLYSPEHYDSYEAYRAAHTLLFVEFYENNNGAKSVKRTNERIREANLLLEVSLYAYREGIAPAICGGTPSFNHSAANVKKLLNKHKIARTSEIDFNHFERNLSKAYSLMFSIISSLDEEVLEPVQDYLDKKRLLEPAAQACC